MNLSIEDISNLDKIILGLSKYQYDTVPELLDGWETFPHPGDPTDQKYRLYEGVLIDNNVCTVKESWTPNSVFSGFKALKLDSKGYYLVYNNKSIQELIQQFSKAQADSLSINIQKLVMGDNYSNVSGIVVNRSTLTNSLNRIYRQLGEDDLKTIEHVTKEVELSGNKDAIENIEAFHEEVKSPKPKSSLLKSFWNGVVEAVPKLLTNTEKVVTIIDKIGRLSQD